jgi:type I restriction enzyme, R subunit
VSELSAVQMPLWNYADEVGWQKVSPDDAMGLRGSIAGLFFTETLIERLLALNPGFMTAELAQEVLRRLKLAHPSIQGNREMMRWMRGEMSIFVPAESRERNVRLIDFENVANNRFHSTIEWRHKSTVYTNRADVVFLINGIPVAITEAKNAGKPDGLGEGIEQLRRYHRETPEMLVAPQVFEVTQLLDFYYGATWSTSRKNVFNWKDEQDGDFEAKVKGFFEPTRFLRILRDYIVFLEKDDQVSKIILRQHQTRAVEKVVERVREPHKQRGLVWHTQGSGKTLTMITIAARLLREPGSEKPTVIMLVDRNELESQLFSNVSAYGIGSVQVAQSKDHLRRLLREDFRGLIVTMIHKFDDVPEAINTRESIVVLADEAHRSTGGDLGNYLFAALPNATLIGFTGTPIDRLSKGKGTFKIFGIEDERGYLDKYNIAESIRDGTTLPLHYALSPSELLVDKEALERQFLSLTESEGVADVEELNALLDKAVELKELMKSPERVEAVAAYVANHFSTNVQPMGFKAFLVAVDREACAFYKKALDKHLPPEASAVVMSAGHNDPEHLKAFHLQEDQEKAIRKAFVAKSGDPQILIVTEKLLTGFDAPILYCLYLDKPMRDHVLLQTIARVNRPYEDAEGLVKPLGFVLDFVGIFEKLERALSFDSDVVASVIQNLDVLRQRFEKLMAEDAIEYLASTKGWTDKDKERAISSFEEKEKRVQFFEFYKELQTLYDILSPDAFLRPHIDRFQALTALYALVREAYSPRVYVDRELTDKTKRLVRETTSLYRIDEPTKVHTLGADQLSALRRGDTSDISKVLNLNKLIVQAADKDGDSKPFLISIAERAESARQALEDRKITTQQALEEFEQLAEEYVKADEERQKLGLTENSYGVFIIIRQYTDGVTPDQAKQINDVVERHPEFGWDLDQQRSLRNELYRLVRPWVGSKMVELVNKIMGLVRL